MSLGEKGFGRDRDEGGAAAAARAAPQLAVRGQGGTVGRGGGLVHEHVERLAGLDVDEPVLAPQLGIFLLGGEHLDDGKGRGAGGEALEQGFGRGGPEQVEVE